MTYDRKPVRVLYEDRRSAVLANDGAVPPGLYVAQNNAAALNRALKAQAASGTGKGLRKTPDHPAGPVLHFARRTGRSERDEHAQPVTSTEYLLSMNPDSGLTREEALGRVLADLREAQPGVDVEAEQPLAHLISHMLSGVYAQVAVKVYGDDLDKLKEVAERVRAAIADVPGVTPPVVEAQERTGEVHIRLRADDLLFHGLTREHVASVLQAALQGETVSQVVDGRRRFDLVVRLDDPYRADLARLGKLRIDRPGGRGQVLLEEVADIGDGAGPNAVSHENVRRRIVIRCNARGRDLGSVAADVERRVRDRVALPPGYEVDFGGQFESQRRATRLIASLAVVSAVGMFAVLLVAFPSVRVVLQILNALPTAFVGGVLALVLTRQTLTVAALVGFVSLDPEGDDEEGMLRHALTEAEKVEEENDEEGRTPPEALKALLGLAMEHARHVWFRQRVDAMVYAREQFEEIEVLARMATPDAEINVLRQGFVLLMTAFDAAVFDLTRIAFRRKFFELVGAFGKQDKVTLEGIGEAGSFEAFREQVIEEQLKKRYAKDVLGLLQGLGVELVDEERGDKPVQLVELVLRRNLHVHSRGVVDERYLEADPKSGKPRYNLFDLKCGQTAVIDDAYFQTALRLCETCVERLVRWAEA